jgi:phasin
MTQSTAGATKAKTANHAVPPRHEIPHFDLPNMEMPEAFREMSEKGAAHAKDTYEKAQVAAGQATDLMKNTYAIAAEGATNYNLKVFENTRTNTNSAFDYARDVFGAKSLSEFVELSTAHARKQFEAMTEQTKALTELTQNMTTEMAEPLKSGLTRAFNGKSA